MISADESQIRDDTYYSSCVNTVLMNMVGTSESGWINHPVDCFILMIWHMYGIFNILVQGIYWVKVG